MAEVRGGTVEFRQKSAPVRRWTCRVGSSGFVPRRRARPSAVFAALAVAVSVLAAPDAATPAASAAAPAASAAAPAASAAVVAVRRTTGPLPKLGARCRADQVGAFERSAGQKPSLLACAVDGRRVVWKNAAPAITVAAASDVRPAFDVLADLFATATGAKVTFSYGSSGQLRQQIVNGAPFDLFASADVAYINEVIAAGRGVASTKSDYAYGRIVLWTADQSGKPSKMEDLVGDRFRRIAIANPDHAPYGLAAKQALQTAGIYDQVADRLVLGENIAETFQIAKSGNADVGIVALSLAIANGGSYTLVPTDLYQPLRQALVVTGIGPNAVTAAAFAAFVSSPKGRIVMNRFGFVLPGENVTASTG